MKRPVQFRAYCALKYEVGNVKMQKLQAQRHSGKLFDVEIDMRHILQNTN